MCEIPYQSHNNISISQLSKKRCQRSLIYRTWPVGMAITQTWQRYPKRHQETSKGWWNDVKNVMNSRLALMWHIIIDMIWNYDIIIFLIDIGIIIWKIVLYDWNSNVIKSSLYYIINSSFLAFLRGRNGRDIPNVQAPPGTTPIFWFVVVQQQQLLNIESLWFYETPLHHLQRTTEPRTAITAIAA